MHMVSKLKLPLKLVREHPSNSSYPLSTQMMIMTDEISESTVLKPEDLRAVYAIGLAIAQTENIDSALDLIVLHTRNVLIFDNMVLYLPKDPDGLTPSFARVIGRGKCAQGEIEWGAVIASQAFSSKQTSLRQEKLDGWENNRLYWRGFLWVTHYRGGGGWGGLGFCGGW